MDATTKTFVTNVHRLPAVGRKRRGGRFSADVMCEGSEVLLYVM